MLFARRAIATLPPLNRSPMMPEPTTVARSNIDPNASAASFRPKGFAQNAVLVCREIDHAIGNDDVDRIVREWNLFDLTLEKFDVFDTGLLLILTRKREHFVRHVEAIDFAR